MLSVCRGLHSCRCKNSGEHRIAGMLMGYGTIAVYAFMQVKSDS